MARLAEGLARVVLDTNCCIYYLEGPASPRRDLLTPLFHAAADGDCIVVLPAVVVLELLTGPIRAGDSEAEAAVRLFATELPGVEVCDLTFDIAAEAARVRAKYGLRTPDASIVASAILRADGVVGNDASWAGVAETRFLRLDSYL